MTNELETDIYATLIGVMEEKNRIPGVENAFAPGSYCDKCYEEMMDCRERIQQRLGVEDDEDVEGMVIALESIQTDLCIRMFRLGRQFGKMEG